MKMCLKILPHQIKHFDKNLVAERIENLVTLLAAVDDLPAAQDRQMLRNVGLLNAQPFLDGAGWHLTIAQNLQYGDTGRMRESLKDTGLVFLQRVLHKAIIFDWSNILNLLAWLAQVTWPLSGTLFQILSSTADATRIYTSIDGVRLFVRHSTWP
jgi:hypothetical protein